MDLPLESRGALLSPACASITVKECYEEEKGIGITRI
jgi:hypothetical protein